MDFAVIHTIKNPDAWNQAIAAAGNSLRDGFSLPVFVVAKDKSRAVCIWHAPDGDVLQAALDQDLGESAVNDVFAVDIMRLGE